MNAFLPMDQQLLDATLSVFRKISHVTLSLAGLVLVAQFAILAISFSGSQSYVRVLRDIILLFAATQLFPSVLQILIKSVGDVAKLISYSEFHRTKGAVDEIFEIVKNGAPILGLLGDIGELSVLYLVRATYSILLAVLCAIAPLVLLSGLVTGISGASRGLFQSIVAMSIWPIVWNAIGLLAREIWPSFGQTSLSSVCFWFVVSVVQILCPLFSFFLFRSLSPADIVKTSSVVKLVSKVILK